ncbi:MAG: ferredoxin [Lysobacterales bacterium CG17_big_fil_post_rev_8_21_14_2_50_64_11]|nr:MAG: ferredoxin [Xanthomonadales bacterium CG17_big_fil_post_rev_8_21_14_2_50_64_11]PIX59218.1 MAG: ferredoxin [Xanthomonadales bacterium CG_4_10_14_3_um_filter_64_11]
MLQPDDNTDVSVSLNAVLAELPEGAASEAVLAIDGDAASLIVTRVAGCVHAFRNVCPHAGRRLDWAPGAFLIDRGRLVCAAHGASFDMASGLCVAGPCKGASLTRVAVLPEA